MSNVNRNVSFVILKCGKKIPVELTVLFSINRSGLDFIQESYPPASDLRRPWVHEGVRMRWV